MSEGLNRCQLIGNLTADPELRFANSGDAVLNSRIACNERYKDKDGEWTDKAEFIDFTIWGKRAEALSKILEKGRQVYVEGSLRTRSWEDNDGNKRYKTEVNARQLILLGGRTDGERREQRSQETPSDRQSKGDDWD